MKILIIQLARLGDIYLSWPAIRALKRNYPNSQISLLTRDRFVAAVDGLTAVDEIITLPLKKVFEPLIQDQMDVVLSHQNLKSFVHELQEKKFDRIINLSFSPASSYLVHLLDSDSCLEGQKVSGYTRTSDGFLCIPDAMSAYFYAQVGYQKPNRFHLAEIFGTLCGVDIEAQDWVAPDLSSVASLGSYDFILHVGASEAHKTISADKWIAICSQLKSLHSGVRIALIGAQTEIEMSEKIMSSLSGLHIENFVGKTNLQQTMKLIQQASVLVGADSAPMHMASLVQTKCLNLSLGRVNFWETGPRTVGSFVLRGLVESDLPSDKVARHMLTLLSGGRPEVGVIQTKSGTPSYSGLFSKDVDFAWKLTQAVYQGTEFPQPVDSNFWQAHEQLLEINQFLIAQMTDLQNGAQISERAALIDRGEEVIAAIAKIVPAWAPVFAWYQTEKIRIPPGEASEILIKTLEIQNLLQQLLLFYAEMKESLISKESEAT